MGSKGKKKNELRERRVIKTLSDLKEWNYDNYFINPYTFIPIQDKGLKGEKSEPERGAVGLGELTGVLGCSMEIKSPTFIPNTTKDFKIHLKMRDEKSKSEKNITHSFQEFYSYEDLSDRDEKEECKPAEPIIPGSEIRGMVRNIYEQLTNSCLLEIDETNLPYKRTSQPKSIAVMVYEEDRWWLYLTPNIKKIQIKDSEILKNEPYILHVTGNINEKKYAIAFHEEQSGEKTAVSADAIQRLRHVLVSYCDKKINKKGDYDVYKAYLKRLDQKQSVLVYVDSTNTYLSPSCMTKEFFENKIQDILQKQGEHDPCKDIGNACPACQLFGMAGENGAIAGRLRFMDSHKSNNILFGPKTILPILGKPRISATEFYLKAPEVESGTRPAMWNYDYYTQYKQAPQKRQRQEEIRTKYTPKLMGRKVYWHGTYKGIEDTGEKKLDVYKTEMNVSVRPILEGTFFFKVYFQDITEEELNNLIFCLTLNQKGIHKIGKGKPIGMGDCRIFIEQLFFRKYEIVNNQMIVKEIQNDTYKNIKKEETGVVKQILTYTYELEEKEKAIVAYPSMESSDQKVFEWFKKNRGSVSKPTIDQVLPTIVSEDIKLKKEK